IGRATMAALAARDCEVVAFVRSDCDAPEGVGGGARAGGEARDDGVEALAGAIAVHDDGYLLTSARALGEATDVLVQTHDGRTMTAVVIGHDHETDLSVLKADGLIKPAMVGGSPAVDGDVVAVVDPTGPAQRRTVTGDVASSIAVDGDPLVGLVGLDGARDELPAGSPVLDATGAVVGIVTATDPAAKVTVVPITVANAVAEDIIAAGRARKAWLGVSAGTDGERVVITAITPDSPAAQAGLAVDDLVAAIDDRSIDTPAAMVAALRGHAPGDEIPVTIERDGVATAVEVVLGSVDD
ncbi:MAG: PDZ domain-containing protein, partial [Actinomycetota bacterium]